MTTNISCGAGGAPESFPELGRNVAAGWPPIYYSLASIWTKLFPVNEANSLFIVRGFSVFAWSLGAGLFCYALISRNKISKETAVAISLLIVILPMGLFQSVFVTPHCLTLIWVSAIYLFATSPQSMSPKNLLKFTVIASLAVLSVPHIFPVILFFTLRFFFNYLVENEVKTKIIICTISCISIIPIIVTAVWYRFQSSRQLDVTTATQPSSPFSLDKLPNDLFKFIPHSIDGYQFLNPWQFLISYLISVLFLALIFKPLVEIKAPLLAKVDSLLLISISCIFAVLVRIVIGINIPPRYGLPLIFISFFGYQ